MAKNRLTITYENDSIRLSWQRGQENPRFADAVPFQHPFDEQALTDLRWYLEEFLRFPYGIEPDKAKKIEQKFQEWGEQLFSLVFRSSEKARQFFQAATWDGLNQCQLSITSDDPAVLNLPWELLYSPDDRKFLAPSLAQMYRSLSDYKVRGEMGEMQQEKLNILLVIARPVGDKIGFQTIARPMLAALKPIRQQVNLKVLRPPSFQEFERELNNNKSFYHIVHFDGHGEFDPNSVGFQHSFGGAGQGLLVFENPDGSPQYITATQIAQSITDCGVPIFVLNACKSAQEGSEPFSSVATRLVAEGAKGVVAMAYSVYAVGAKHFIGRLYEQLVRGKSLAEAVAAGRLEMLNQRLRPSPKGDLLLQDWLVPVLYQQQFYQPFTPKPAPASREERRKARQEAKSRSQMDIPADVGDKFIGRDYDILRLERAFRQNHVVLLQGMAGVGKTELTGGFARWLDETQGRIGGIFFTSFEQGAGLSGVVNRIGKVVWGDNFSSDLPEDQLDDVMDYLQNNSCLLIWDNFEPVAGFPTGNEPLLPADERDNLQRFLKELRGGKSWVLITSRREERWLDCGYTLLNLKGLDEKDAEEFAAKVLRTVGVDRAKLPKEYLELLKLLGGHPLSLRVVLPHLKTQIPVQLIEDLRRGGDRFKGVEEEGRDKSLIVSLDYSFARLSERCQRHLPFLGLFSERISANLLHFFSSNTDTDDEFWQAYRAVFGENLQKSDWLKILNEAAEASILEHLGDTLYKVHPALPWYLRQRLSEQHSEEVISELEKKLLIFYAVLADNYRQQLVDNAEIATFMLQLEEPNLLQNLRVAEQQQNWEDAQAILQALGEVYQRIGRQAEFKMLRQRVINQIGIHPAEAKAKGESAFNFWMYLRGVDADEALVSGNLEQARAIYQEILDELIALNDASVNDKIAVSYHQLGMVAQEKRQFYEAISYYQKVLKIREDAEDLYKNVTVYQHLGTIAQEQRQFEQAISYYQKALKICEDTGNIYQAASVYHKLGIVAQKQRQFERARDFYQKALKIEEDAGNLHGAASNYHQLGMVAEEQQQFEQARDFYQKALKILEDEGYLYQVAAVYNQLGTVAQEQRRFEEAISYYQKAFEVLQERQDWHHASMTLGNYGNVLEAQENWREALKIYIRVLAIDIEHNKEWISSRIRDLARMLKQLGESEFEAIWREVTGGECDGDVRAAIWSARENLEIES